MNANFVSSLIGSQSESATARRTPPEMMSSQQLLCMNSILAAAAASSSMFKQPPPPPPPSAPTVQQGQNPLAYHPFAFTPYGPYNSDFAPKFFPRIANHHQDAPHHSVHPRYGQSPDDPKPAHSYIGLIAKAILSMPDQKMVLADIYQYILDNYSYFRNRGPGWRNSIRHNLSLNDCFMKAGRCASGKGHYWAIHPANLDDFIKGDFRRRKAQRKVRRHMGLAVPDDEDSEDDEESPLPSPNSQGPMIHPMSLASPGNNPLLTNSMPDPATALLLSNPQLLAMSANPLFGQLSLFNSLRAQMPQLGPMPVAPPQPPPNSAQLFNQHLYKQLINLNLKHQHLQSMVEQRKQLDSPPATGIKKEFSIESLLRPSIPEQSSRTPSPTIHRKSPGSDFEVESTTPVNLKMTHFH